VDTPEAALAKHIGVTRLADLTGLDRLGLPVVAAIRPLSRNISVSFGKGLTVEHARRSALMEAAELFYSETPPFPLVTQSFGEFASGIALNPAALCPIDSAVDCARKRFEWVQGTNLKSRNSVMVPWQIISMDFTELARQHERVLQFGATGLAADFDQSRAVLHGLYEVIERDCHMAWNNFDDATRAATLVDHDGIEDQSIRDLLTRLALANLQVVVWDMTGESNIPCYLAELVDAKPGATTAFVQGAAADLSPQVALRKAIVEAMQVRLTYIAGSRDDLEWSDYGDRYDDVVRSRQSLVRLEMPRKPMTPDSGQYDGSVAALRETQRRLQNCGIGDIAVVRLSPADNAVCVVKVIVPTLVDIPDANHYVEQRRHAVLEVA
jgi:YcaO-like protein with predicted kinase domain